MSRAYRFQKPVNSAGGDQHILLRKHSKKSPVPAPNLIGADNFFITDKDGTRSIHNYTLHDREFITLTNREADLIALANPGIAPPKALEKMHPWIPERRFLNNSKSSYNALKSIARRFQHLFINSSWYCDQKWNTICNAVRRQTHHDQRFYSAWHLPIQDTYALEERRRDRGVIAIDFNAMYPSCMQHEFPKPSALRLIKLGYQYKCGSSITPGLYRCILTGPSTEFISRHNPFRSFYSGRHLRALLDEPLEVDLNEFELTYFCRHFQSIHLVEAVVSEETIAHPLARDVRRSFARRLNYQDGGNKSLAEREKFLATLMTSCASRPSRSSRTFPTRSAAMAYARSMYGIETQDDEPEVASEIWLDGRKGILLRTGHDGVQVQGPALLNGSACYLLGQRIVARSRVVLLHMMERVLASAPDVEICYANIDSIHFSLPKAHIGSVITWLEGESSRAMGAFKIEAITDHGLWLEPGRYWLYSDTHIVKFRNRSVGDRRSAFKDYGVHVATWPIGDLHVPIRMTLSMERTMSSAWSIHADHNDDMLRLSLIAVGEKTVFSDVLDELESNKWRSIPARMRAFRDLRDVMEHTRSAASLRVCDAIIM